MTDVVTEMPRSRSTFIQSLRARRRSPRALTAPASWIAPPNSSSFSVRVVLPASGCAMIAKVRRFAISAGYSGVDMTAQSTVRGRTAQPRGAASADRSARDEAGGGRGCAGQGGHRREAAIGADREDVDRVRAVGQRVQEA